ncbi:class I SAM-dependent methyltransferase [Fontibacillus sp. BL9]|uniref:class I SAM-dependent methyltransferase n=1 Tax=Fontibacillus sp. BL9 TaxID=3389971 RepID=UPI00397C259A
MLRNDDIYGYISTPYDLLVSKEDYSYNIPATLAEIVDFSNKDVADLGAGTGRLTTMVASRTQSIVAVDFAADMLKVTASKLDRMGLTNWKTCVADLRQIPLQNQSMDIIMAGWSICYVGSSNHEAWEQNLSQVMTEIFRILRPGGTVIILETLGTGNTEPSGPEFLMNYYEALERQYGFKHKAIRTDYEFDSAEQAEQLCRDFFGDELGDKIKEKQLTIVPECTGVWWKGV